MRITFIMKHVDMSGGSRVISTYARLLTESGHQVLVLSQPNSGPSIRRKCLSFVRGKGWPARPKAVPSHLDDPGVDHRLLERQRPVVDKDVPDADVVLATWWETAEWVNALSPAKGAKVYFVQGHEVWPWLPVQRCKATYRLPLRKIVVSSWLADIMRKEYGDTDVDVVPNSVDHNLFCAPVRGKQACPTVGFVYHEAGTKGMDVITAVLSKLRGKYPELRVVSIGVQPPPLRFVFEHSIEFHHLPPQESLRELYASCDVWLSASRCEGFNLPAMEAMACRTPVVATRTGWPVEAVVSGSNGMLVDVDDADGLAAGATWALSLPDAQWRQISSRAYETVADSSWEASAELFEQALLRACRGEHARLSHAATLQNKQREKT